MESERSDNEESQNNSSFNKQASLPTVITTSNWEINNSKNFSDCVSTVSILQAPESTNLDDVVSLDTCVALKSDPSGESCRLEFKLNNKQRIVRIAVVSEASVLEFFKQSGEYATTVFAEFVDDFQDHAVYFAEAKIQPPSSEAGIKFTRTKNKGTTMWIYGIKLILTEPTSEKASNLLNSDVINSLLSNVDQSRRDKMDMAKKLLESFVISENDSVANDMKLYVDNLGRFSEIAPQSNKISNFDGGDKNSEYNGSSTLQYPIEELKLYIDDKFSSLEQRLTEKIKLMDEKMNQKLDAVLQKLEYNFLQE
ncbi:uncharacterized protein LOC106637900 [Copidosoma floridanum]|uniref:uncharacterized protein LOC106637900 n=1 Tax=Copidosoma floridanum TaxID=29053 RepID=UPI0006C951CA|nr:uncharacterized protein LOC106637900 [Copidosoma floridanum]